MVGVDLEIALGANHEVHEPVARHLIQHVLEEGDPGDDVALAGAVEIEGQLDPGLDGLALDGGTSVLHDEFRADRQRPPPGTPCAARPG